MPVWSPFEHLIWRNLDECGLADTNSFLLAVSGGLDSVVLLEVMRRLKATAKFEVAHFHHGVHADPVQHQYRDDCQRLVSQLTAAAGIPFQTERSGLLLESEEDCRTARWSFLNSVKSPGQIVLTAHHQDDHLETMMLKLIRGSGPDGFSAFKMWNGEIFRPFLNVSKNELLTYAETNKLTWIDDPSNKDTSHLRNWLRETWLPALEERVPGGRSNLSRSLTNIAAASTEIQPFELSYAGESMAMSRLWFDLLPAEQQLRALSLYLRKHSIFEFSMGQLNEIRKRLDKNQKDITFDLVGKKWVINATQIMLR
jgi:tRNA(Ile)-lysidine synthase